MSSPGKRNALPGLSLAPALLVLALIPASVGGGEEDRGDKEPGCQKDEKVAWLGYEQALDRAAEKDVPVVLVFYRRSCRKCEVLESKGFNRPDIACYVNRKLAPARIDADDNDELEKEYGATHCPMVWFLEPSGRRIDFFTGYVKPERLWLIIRYIGERVYRAKTFEEYEKEENEEER